MSIDSVCSCSSKYVCVCVCGVSMHECVCCACLKNCFSKVYVLSYSWYCDTFWSPMDQKSISLYNLYWLYSVALVWLKTIPYQSLVPDQWVWLDPHKLEGGNSFTDCLCKWAGVEIRSSWQVGVAHKVRFSISGTGYSRDLYHIAYYICPPL